jgi:hypothetical protein
MTRLMSMWPANKPLERPGCAGRSAPRDPPGTGWARERHSAGQFRPLTGKTLGGSTAISSGHSRGSDGPDRLRGLQDNAPVERQGDGAGAGRCGRLGPPPFSPRLPTLHGELCVLAEGTRKDRNAPKHPRNGSLGVGPGAGGFRRAGRRLGQSSRAAHLPAAKNRATTRA